MREHNNWLLWLYNVIVVICWTVIAVIFDKWWLMLLSTFMLAITNGHYIQCDVCGKHGPKADNKEAALYRVTKLGWIREYDEGGWCMDICPECQAKRKE